MIDDQIGLYDRFSEVIRMMGIIGVLGVLLRPPYRLPVIALAASLFAVIAVIAVILAIHRKEKL